MASRDLIVHIVGDDASLQRAYKRSTAETQKFQRTMSQTVRGAAAGSSVFKTLGRSLAFASGGFLATASITNILSDSITEATEAAQVQRQLAAQFKASGQNLAQYQQQIDQTTTRLSLMTGIQDEELTQSFISAFRGTQNVSTGLKIQAIAADVARARNISLSAATIALTKAFNGQTTALRRLGVNVPATLHGMEALGFVQEKFAGQAKAAATPQERFATALKETEEIIGTTLLPTFNEFLDSITEWLSKEQNRQNVQQKANTTWKTLGVIVGGVHDAWNLFMQDFALGGQIKQASEQLADVVFQLKQMRGELEKMPGFPGVAGPVGTPSLGPGSTIPGLTGPVGGGPKKRASLAFQMSMLQEQLAKAELTATTKDDRAVLVRMQNLLKRRIAATKDLKLRTQLYQDLVSVNKQIEAIDDKIAADKQDAADKEKAAKQKERDIEKKRLEAHRDHIRRIRQLWADQLQKIRDATAQVNSEFGALPFQATPTGILGVTGMGSKSFVGAYTAQTRTFVSFYNDLGKLIKRGAPIGLVNQIRSELGVGGAPLVRSLLTHPGQLRTLIKSFDQRREAAMQIAKADIHARYVTVHIAGSRPGATSSTQRRGRQAGVPTSIGSYIGG